jgi:hypothetical protein
MRQKYARIFAVTGGFVLLVGAACAPPATRQLGALRQLAKSCPKDQRLAGYVAEDVSRSQRGSRLAEARLAALKAVASQVAVCRGHLRVVVFTASVAASSTVFDGDLDPAGATSNARWLRVPALVSKTAGAVAKRTPGAVRALTPDGVDPLGQLTAAADYARQLGSGYRLLALVETSGISTAPLAINEQSLTAEAAPEMARRVALPDLPGTAVVVFAGLGRVGAGPPPSADFINALKTYYTRVCERTGARACSATSDLRTIGGWK